MNVVGGGVVFGLAPVGAGRGIMKKVFWLLVACVGLALSCRAQAASIGLQWDPSPDVVAGYKIYQGGLPAATVGASETKGTVSNLVAGVSYSFFVTAFDANGVESDPSNTVQWAPADGNPVPPVLISQSVAKLSNSQWRVSVGWQPVSSRYVVSGYYVVFKQGALFLTNGVGTNISAVLTIPAVSPTVTYLQASNYFGLSALGQVATFSQPGASKNLRVVLP